MKITAIVVTYNRKALLEKCLSALAVQTHSPDSVLVVDNASTDGTLAWLEHWRPRHLPQAVPVSLNRNTGGAGGFSEGMRLALVGGADWVWMMDDDAYPHPEALEALVEVARDPANLYGSLAVNGGYTSWTITLLDQGKTTQLTSDVPTTARVDFIPFLGFLINRKLIEKIGYPDAEYFIAADDVEYCLRARRAGADILIAGQSHIEHPRAHTTVIRLFGFSITYLSLAPWKRYYDTRNRLLIARKYYGIKLFTHVIPGSFVRLFAALAKEPNKAAQMRAFGAGIFDGLIGLKGKRHLKWGIK